MHNFKTEGPQPWPREEQLSQRQVAQAHPRPDITIIIIIIIVVIITTTTTIIIIIIIIVVVVVIVMVIIIVISSSIRSWPAFAGAVVFAHGCADM